MRCVGSAHTDPYLTTAGAAAALAGPLHGGANEEVLKMLDEIGSKDNVPGYVKKIKEGPLSKTRMEEGFIITTVNGSEIKNTEELGQALGSGYGKVKLEGIYPGYNGVYTYTIDLGDESDN